MGIKKVQFQKGLSIAAFIELYGTEEQCHAALVASRWATAFICPSCACSRHCTFERKGLQYWHCTACREQTTVTCRTIFQATKLPLTRWFLAMHLLTQAKNNVSLCPGTQTPPGRSIQDGLADEAQAAAGHV